MLPAQQTVILVFFVFLKNYGRNILRYLHCNKLSLFIPSVVDLKEITKDQVSILVIGFARTYLTENRKRNEHALY